MAGKMQDPLVVDPANGVTRGDDRAYPNRGTTSGFLNVGGGHYGADVDMHSKNRQGGIGAAADSDPMFATIPPGSDDAVHRADPLMDRGRGMGNAAQSDAAGETEPNEPAGRHGSRADESDGY